MYSDKENVNILTALLVAHGVKNVVVCPGSRNGALVHNFNECPDIECHPVTDERSAGFFALGLRQATGRPVAVCVTSGSALLNTLPAAAEAAYQSRGIIVISADRPSAWIGQLDGQTIPQQGALGSFVSVSVNAVEPHDEASRWQCNRDINEALLEAERPESPSVHINVPITEPLFNFTVEALPQERAVRRMSVEAVTELVMAAKRPMLVTGQLPEGAIDLYSISVLSNAMAVLAEPVTVPSRLTDQMLYIVGGKHKEFVPDCVVYVGGNTVSKRMRHFLREDCGDSLQIYVSPDGKLRDISCHTDVVVEAMPAVVVETLSRNLPQGSPFSAKWLDLRTKVEARHLLFQAGYSEMLAVRMFEDSVKKNDTVHYANSMSVRLGTLFARHYIHCNRGINGIEGSLSTAAGASLAKARVYCVIGDLSFFYDQNALWQTQLGGNFRILLLNNGQGGIFRSLPGLYESPAAGPLIAGKHNLNAEGVCSQFGVKYLHASDEKELEVAMRIFTTVDSDRPVLLEVTTDAVQDQKIYSDYNKFIADEMD